MAQPISKFMFFTDLHLFDGPSYPFFAWPTDSEMGERRVTRTAPERLQKCLDDCVANDIDLLVFGGDWLDSSNGDALDESGDDRHQIMQDSFDFMKAHDFMSVHNGKIIMIRGNHDFGEDQGDTYGTFADWDTQISYLGADHLSRTSPHVVDSVEVGFVVDTHNVRFICCHHNNTVTYDESAFYTWLGDRASETDLPIILMQHVTGGEGSSTPASSTFTQAFQDVLLANDNVQLILAGHDHRGKYPVLSQNWYENMNHNEVIAKKVLDSTLRAKDIFIFMGQGGLRPLNNVNSAAPWSTTSNPSDPSDISDEDFANNAGADNSAHYIISIKPFAFKGVGTRRMADLKIEGFDQGTIMNKDWEKKLYLK